MKKIIAVISILIFVFSGGYIYLKFYINNHAELVGNVAGSEAGKSAEEKLKCKDCNIVIISLTNTRKDHVGLYGYERDTTPNIDEFFKNSLIFENAFAPASWTLPVAASFFSSLFPYAHGVMDRYVGSRLSDDVVTFTELLKQNGYQTAGFTGGGDYGRRFNFSQGFDVYVDEGGSTGPVSYFGTEESLPEAMKWLNSIDIKSKFFLFVQGFDTHCPFAPKEPFNGKFIGDLKSNINYNTCLWTFEQTNPIYKNGIKYWPVKTMSGPEGIRDMELTDEDVKYMLALYDGEIAQADDNLRSFFQAIKDKNLEKNTIFIFISEHGDLFGEHGRFMRGGPLRGTFYDPVLNFPLVIKHPKIDVPQKIDALVQTVDLMPSLLEILGIHDSQREKRQGKSIVPVIMGTREVNSYVYAGSQYKAINNDFFNGFSKIEMIRNKEWKFIREEVQEEGNNEDKINRYELFNVVVDKNEDVNLYGSDNDDMAYLPDKLSQWIEKINK